MLVSSLNTFFGLHFSKMNELVVVVLVDFDIFLNRLSFALRDLFVEGGSLQRSLESPSSTALVGCYFRMCRS